MKSCFLPLVAAGALSGVLCAGQTPPDAPPAPSPGGFGAVRPLFSAPPEGCLSRAGRAWLHDFMRQHRAAPGPRSGRAAPPPFAFYPLGGNPDEDIVINGFADLDPAPAAFHDFDCTALSYDGHDASDTNLRSFEEQALGVAVYAAQDGVVLYARDGKPDMNLNGSTDLGNFVGIDHGNGRVCWYFHLKKNSVAVAAGQTVRAGQQIGLAASSGNSYYPHLHFATYDHDLMFEPFAGPCRPGASGWLDQPPLHRSFQLIDCAVTWQDLWTTQPLPWPQPRDGDFALSDGFVYFWLIGEALPGNSTWRAVFERPDGSVAYDSGDQPFGWSHELRFMSLFWYYWIPEMHSITGTWHWRHFINGVEVTRAPVEVVPQRLPGFNRPPLPVQVRLSPQAAGVDDALLARLLTTAGVDDPDYDVLAYRYEWRVDGQVVRDVVLAGHADALPAGSAALGQSVQCAVTVSDGAAALPPAVDALVIGGGDPLRLTAPLPGVAGAANSLRAEGAAPGALVYLAWSFQTGTSPLPGCPGKVALLANPNLAAAKAADQNGVAAYSFTVPVSLAGRTVHLQAAAPAQCHLSNLVSYAFP